MTETISLTNEAKEIQYWNNIHEKSINERKFLKASSFAEICAKEFKPKSKILDLGCGTGMDSIAFSSLGHEVMAIDRSKFVEQSKPRIKNLQFKQMLISNIEQINRKFDIFYARSLFDSLTENSQNQLLKNIKKLANSNARIFLEFRTDNDPSMSHGQTISPNERMGEHYRRFINVENFSKTLAKHGYEIISFEEKTKRKENINKVTAQYILKIK